MGLPFLVGLVGSLVLVTGAAWPAKKVKHPVRSVKNWLFAIGAVLMLSYSLLNYFLADGSVFFAFVQGFAVISSVLMMLNFNDKVVVPCLGFVGLGFVIAALYLFEDYKTVVFVLGLIGIAIGYVLEDGTVRRNLMLFAGSVLIAVFSYFVKDWIFVWLNVFFAIFAGYYMIRLWKK